jgi:A/G-specific adenine glycosylase
MQQLSYKKFNQILFAWHKKNYREMEWRNIHDPYLILVSELMLQQTQVERVKEKYALFIKHFPTVKKLAAASLGDVLTVWSGLGYNRRAKYLHHCAKEVVVRYDGKFPNSYDELITLSGIGPSTAGALLAFSFGMDTPMIDTNIRRILVRVFFRKAKKFPTDAELYLFASSLIPRGKGRVWNYAMLDLGATLCTARNHSSGCPLSVLHGKVNDFIYKKPQKKFAGSERFYRGKLIKLLSKEGSVPRTLIEKELKDYQGNFTLLLEKLTREGMIVVQRNRVSLP